MKTNGSVSMLIYLMSLVLFLNYNSLFILWLVMEVNMISFILLMYSFINKVSSQEMVSSCFYYLLIQSLGSTMFLASSLLSSGFIEISLSLFIISLSLKLAIFPFFFWMFKVSQFMSVNIFILLISLQKIPLLFLSFSMESYFYFILALSTIFGSLYLFFCGNMLYLLISSSIYSSFWILFLFNLNFFVVFIFFCFYTFMLVQMGHYISSDSKFSFYSFSSLSKLFVFLFLMGLPPFSIFFYKIMVIYCIYYSWGVGDFLLFWVFSFLALFGYLKTFYKYFFTHLVHYLNNEKVFQKKSFFYFVSGSLLVFLIF